MKTFFCVLLILAVGHIANAQVTISNDSILIASEMSGRFTIQPANGGELQISVLMSLPFSLEQEMEFETYLKRQLAEKNLFTGMRFTFQYFADLSKINPSQVAGMELEAAGINYNNAVTLSILGILGGSALSLTGYPVAGSITTISSGLISLILQISANRKLIKAGKHLQRQK